MRPTLRYTCPLCKADFDGDDSRYVGSRYLLLAMTVQNHVAVVHRFQVNSYRLGRTPMRHWDSVILDCATRVAFNLARG